MRSSEIGQRQRHFVLYRQLYLKEIAASPSVPSSKCKELYDLEILSRDQLSESFLESLPLEQLSLLMWKMYRHCLFIGGPDTTVSFSDYKDCFQVSALLLLDKLRKNKGYMVSLCHCPRQFLSFRQLFLSFPLSSQ